MSGDVQPRKRKDKRRKKDDDDAGTPPPTLINPSSEHSTDNVTIHVHKEGGTGGHWCARIIFFALLSVLVGLIGIIIFEHRGTTDVDTPIASSRWAVIFDGWVDDVLPQHDDEPHGEEENASEEADDHEEEEEEEGAEDDEEDDDEHDDENDETEEDVADKDSAEVDKEVDEGIGSEEAESEDEEDEEDEDEDEGDDEQQDISGEEENISTQNDVTEEDQEDDVDEEKFEDKSDEGFNEEDVEEETEDFDTLEEVENASEEDNDDTGNDDEEEDDEALNNSENELDVSIEGVTGSEERDEQDDASQELFSIPGIGKIDDNSAEPLEEIEDGELEEVINDLDIEPEEEQEEEQTEEESTSVAVKFGVGVALIVAAHFVLVRRWNNVEADLAGSYSDEVLDLSRRNTIIPPVNPKDLIASPEGGQEVVPDEKVVQSYEELRLKYRGLEADGAVEAQSVKKALGKLESLQQKNISLQGKNVPEDKKALLKGDTTGSEKETEEEVEEMQTSESERLSATEPEDEEEEDEEEEGEENSEEEEEDDVDDSELVAKLEAKYGKLPTPTESEEEEEDEDYDDEEEEEEEDDEEEAEEEDEEIQGWKPGVRAPKGPHSSAVGKQQEARGKEAPKGKQSSSSSGGNRIQDNANDSSIDEISIQEEINSWLSKELDN